MSENIELTKEEYKLYQVLCELVDDLVIKFREDPNMSKNRAFISFMMDKSKYGMIRRAIVYDMVLNYLKRSVKEDKINLN